MLFLISSLTFVFLLLLPDNAFAWGPATHIYYGVELLKDLSVLSPWVASILTKFPHDFLYGCISADITVGKKYTHYRKHCHNWRIGYTILSEAESLAQKSFAFGYLNHLAADTIAHNFFVPSRMINVYSRKSLGHVYWEIRADSLIPKEYWKEVGRISKEVQATHDRLIRDIVEGTLFPFDVNKRIFNGILIIHRFKQWRRLVRKLAARSRWSLDPEEVKKYHRLSSLAILDLMISFESAECMKLDPTGRVNLRRARMLRRSLRRLARTRFLDESDCRSVLRQLPVQTPFFD